MPGSWERTAWTTPRSDVASSQELRARNASEADTIDAVKALALPVD